MKALVLSVMAGSLLVASPALAETLRLGHVQDQSDPLNKAAEIFAQTVSEETDGEIDVRIFPAASLGDYEQMQEGVQQGSMDIVIESIGTLSRFSPVAGVESMPYLFDDADQYVAIWNGKVGEEIKAKIAEESNFKLLGHMYRGARQLTSNKPVNSIDDLDGLKIRVSPLRERLVTWQVFGASPTPMSWSEVFTALQQGVIDAQENPLATIQSASINEVQKYLILTSHMANGFTFQMNAEKFDSWPESTQAALVDAANVAAEWYNDYIESEEASILEDLEAKGMQVIKIDRAPFREKAKEVVTEFPDLEPWYAKLSAETADQ